MSGDYPITKEDGLSALKLVIHALIKSGITPDELIEETNSMIEWLAHSEGKVILSANQLKIVNDKQINKHRDIIYDSDRRTIVYKEQRVNLSPNETKLMGHFLRNPGKVITHEEIAKLLYPDTHINSSPAKLCRPLI